MTVRFDVEETEEPDLIELIILILLGWSDGE
jgi:hypothetical protein